MRIFDRLRADHDKLRTLLLLIDKAQAGSPVRAELFDRFGRAFEQHTRAEEASLYAALMKAEATQVHAQHWLEEHDAMRRSLADLRALEMSSAGWARRFEALRTEVLRHLEDEERRVSELADRFLSEWEKRNLGEEYVELHSTR